MAPVKVSATWETGTKVALGREETIPVVKEATALGCAATAAVGVGLFDDLAESGKAFAHVEQTLEPNQPNRAVYAELRSRWETAYAARRALVDKGITEPMWRAPGAH